MNSRTLLIIACLAACLAPVPGRPKDSSAFLTTDESGSAVDVRGLRHNWPPHSGKLSPWMQDRVKLVAPDYPDSEAAEHHAGVGLFRIFLDINTGRVTNVAVLRSTGFSTLDKCAVVAFWQSRWKPGKWKEIDEQVTFTLTKQLPQMPPGSVQIPQKALAIYAPRPAYPLEARYRHLTGSGIVLLQVDHKTGYVTAGRVVKSTGHDILDSAALSAFMRWRFRPGTVRQVRIPFNYMLGRKI